MKNYAIRLSAIVMMLGAFAVVSYGQKTERVKFASGSTDVSLTRTLSANETIDFMFNVRAGQYIQYTPAYDFEKTNLEASLYEPKLTDDAKHPANIDERNVFRVKKGGQHVVSVSNVTRKSVTFTLYLSVTDSDPNADDENTSSTGAGGNLSDNEIPSDAERIQFPKGSIEVNLEKTVPANGAKRFVVWAKAGQEVALTVTPRIKNAKLNMEFGGNPVTQGELYTMIVPKSGDYLLDVLNADGRSHAFALDLGIAAPADEPTERTGGEPVRFASGETSKAITERDISPNGSYDFLINVKKGTTLGVQVSYEGRERDIEAFLSEPNLQDTALSYGSGERKEFVVNKTGDHRLTVVNKTGKKITFSLYVDID